jgi:hypothetical protein
MRGKSQRTNLRGSEPHQRFEIRVRGHLGPTLLEAFPELTAHSQLADTVLSGTLSDHAALYGVLHQVEALGLELLEVRSQSHDLDEVASSTRVGRSGDRPTEGDLS